MEKLSREAEEIMIDRFGKDIMMIPADEEHFIVNVDVRVSGQFFGWIMSLGDGVEIIGPENVRSQMKQEIQRMVQQYQ